MFPNQVSSVVITALTNYQFVSLTPESMKSDRVNPLSRFIPKVIPVRLFLDLAWFGNLRKDLKQPITRGFWSRGQLK